MRRIIIGIRRPLLVASMTVVSLAGGLVLAGCNGGGSGEASGAGGEGTAERTSSAGMASGDAGAVTLGEPVEVDGLTYRVPTSWSSVDSGSQMRRAQYVIPGEGQEDGELVLYFFGEGSGGGTQANIDRWVGQFETAEGAPAREHSTSSHFEHNDLSFTTVEVEGTMKATQMPGMGGGSEDKAGWGMLGAVVEGPGGPWFFKATGPEEVMEEARVGFDAMLRSARAGTGS